MLMPRGGNYIDYGEIVGTCLVWHNSHPYNVAHNLQHDTWK